MPKKKPKLPEHLRGKTPEEITEYIMGGMVRGQPKGETIGDYFAKARSKAAEQARKNEAAGMIEWEEGEWISPAEFRGRQLAAGYAHMDEVAKRGYRERDVAATPIMGALRTANALGNARALAASQGLRTIPENWQNNFLCLFRFHRNPPRKYPPPNHWQHGDAESETEATEYVANK